MKHSVNHAGFWLRTAAQIIDNFIVTIVFYFCFFSIGLTSSLIDNDETISGPIGILFVFIALLLYVGYDIYMPATNWQGTIGKKLVGIKIVDQNGEKLTGGKSALRFLGSAVSYATFGIGYLITAFTPKKQALHDLMVKTYVIQSRVEVYGDSKKFRLDKETYT
ncbi:RDD family protein [Bacillus sp. FJAT-42376]|uniref:RDD family protein n=1 Tax=Bacillus sp. FJAT-42376 TaxID=2014076 RepID=UPI000F4EC693|nr:RDD family protein [Bacillus sp. FJAT-42376]AZB41577.1 RDD family protein [Bacillus sp. FJAT-42376]